MRKLIISLLLFLPLYIIKAQGLSVGTVNAGISGAEMRTVLNTNFSNIKTAVDLKAPLTGSAPGLTVGNVSWIHRDGNSLVSFGTYGGVPGYGSYQFYTPSTGGSNYFYLPLSGTVVMTDPQDTVHFFRGVRLKFPGGHLGWNNSRLGKGWLTDLDVTNTITGSISGNAATVTGFSRGTGSLTLSGNHALTLTTTAATNVTLPTTGTLMTNPMSASGDLLYGGASGVPTRLQAGTNGHVLTLSSGVPSWQEPAAVLHTDTTTLLAPYPKKKLITASLSAGAETDVTLTGVTTEPYSVLIFDSSGLNITDAVKDSTALSGGVYHTWIYSTDALTGVKIKVLW